LELFQTSFGMPAPASAPLRRLWLNVHLWIGLGLAILLVPVSLSGALLVWHDHLDALVNPARYAVTAGPALSPSALLIRAREALPPGLESVAVRLPESAGWPATVSAREQRHGERGAGARPTVLTVYLEPATGRVLGVVEFRRSLVGFLHRFHENLTVTDYSGRAIVGWSGVAMLVMSLTGIYLWWPRNAGFRRGLRWRRGPTISLNLHHLLGFWIAVPIAVVSATGIYLGFPQQGREPLSSLAPMTPQQRGGFAAPFLRDAKLDADRARNIALEAVAQSRLAAIFLPNQQTGMWRVQLHAHNGGPAMTVLVEDRTGTAHLLVPQTGDRIAQWIRWIHEGSHSGPVWQALVFACGILPAILVITGLLIWLRSRRAEVVKPRLSAVPQVEAAE
jgi:uncharacterized iron-regulated membrane protein